LGNSGTLHSGAANCKELCQAMRAINSYDLLCLEIALGHNTRVGCF